MKIETSRVYQLTRPELEEAVRRYCGIDDSQCIDGFWLDSASMAPPKAVCGFSYKIEEPQP